MASKYEFRPSRVYMAVLAGAVVGGVSTALLMLLGSIWQIGASGHDEWLRLRNQTLLFSILGSIVFFVGIVALGVPGWIAMHRLGRRQWYDAVVLGALLAFLGDLAMSYGPLVLHSPGSDYSAWDGGVATVIHYRLTAQGWRFLFEGALLEAVAGALAGLTIWGIAYRAR